MLRHLKFPRLLRPVLAREASSTRTLVRMLPLIWPRDDRAIKGRLITALGLLLGGKLLNVQVPYLFKDLINTVSELEVSHLYLPEGSALYLLWDNPASVLVGSLLLAYGGARIGATAFNELKNVVFSRVTQTVQRQMARRCFEHLLRMDGAFHQQSQPGALARSLDRGIRGVNFLFTALVFNILPTTVEIGLVSSILVIIQP